VFSSPLSLQASASSSTSVRTEWPALPFSAETADTKSLLGYILFYKQTSADSYQKIGIAPAGSSLLETLEELKKFTPYRMVVCPYSRKGNGIPSEPVTVTTLEDGKQCLRACGAILSPVPDLVKYFTFGKISSMFGKF
jgi:hypothetical protein